MIAENDRRFIENCLDNHYQVLASRLPAVSVPAAMRLDDSDDEGFVAWKMLPSTITEDDVAQLEHEVGLTFPPLFRAYLTTRHTLGMDWFDLPNLPINEMLAGLKAVLQSWPWLLTIGYLPFIDDAAGGVGPLCFDTRQRLPDDDCPVILFDREELLALSENERDRDHLEPLAHKTEPSFRAMMIVNFADELTQPSDREDAAEESSNTDDEPLE